MIKLDSLSRWQRLPKGSVLTLYGDTFRRVRLNVNAPSLASFFIVNGDGEPTFLATTDRRDVVEFAHGGDICITTEDDDVFVYTAENEPTFTIIENAEVFTQIAQRAARNPDLEHLMYLQEVNMQRRFAQMENSVNQKVQQAYEAGRSTVAHSDAPGSGAPLPAGTRSEPYGSGTGGEEDSGLDESSAASGNSGDGSSVGASGNDGSSVLRESAV